MRNNDKLSTIINKSIILLFIVACQQVTLDFEISDLCQHSQSDIKRTGAGANLFSKIMQRFYV